MLFPRLRHVESVIFGCDYPPALAIIPHLVIITSVLEYIILAQLCTLRCAYSPTPRECTRFGHLLTGPHKDVNVGSWRDLSVLAPVGLLVLYFLPGG